jgi:riboflavin synthase
VDATGRVRGLRRDGVSRVLAVEAPEAVRCHLVDRGSVAVDGVSLTVTAVTPSGFEVTLIPATLEQTTLADLRTGEVVNLETDIVSKYVARQVQAMAPGGAITPADWLASTEE